MTTGTGPSARPRARRSGRTAAVRVRTRCASGAWISLLCRGRLRHPCAFSVAGGTKRRTGTKCLQSMGADDQRSVSTPIAPSATAAAVEVRSTVGPSRTAVAPAPVRAAISSSDSPLRGRPPASPRARPAAAATRTATSPTRAALPRRHRVRRPPAPAPVPAACGAGRRPRARTSAGPASPPRSPRCASG